MSALALMNVALNERSNAAKEINSLIRSCGVDHGFEKAGELNKMKINGLKDILAEDYVRDKLHSIKRVHMEKVKNVLPEANYTANIVKTSCEDDGTYEFIRIINSANNEIYICEIDFIDELPRTIEVFSDVEDHLPTTFVGTDADLRRLVAAISDEPGNTSRLTKWLGPAKVII